MTNAPGTLVLKAILFTATAYGLPLAVGGALAADLVPWERWRGAPGYLALAAAFSLGFAALSWPVLGWRATLPPLTAADTALALLVTTAAGAGVAVAASRIGRAMAPPLP